MISFAGLSSLDFLSSQIAFSNSKSVSQPINFPLKIVQPIVLCWGCLAYDFLAANKYLINLSPRFFKFGHFAMYEKASLNDPPSRIVFAISSKSLPCENPTLLPPVP
jgi:hypothetical protein